MTAQHVIEQRLNILAMYVVNGLPIEERQRFNELWRDVEKLRNAADAVPVGDLVDEMIKAAGFLVIGQGLPITHAQTAEIVRAAVVAMERAKPMPFWAPGMVPGRLVIEFEKQLCALLGKPWTAAGMSCESLLAEVRAKLEAGAKDA